MTARSPTFVGLVRDHNAGRRVLWLDYEAYEPLAVKAFERIDDEAARAVAASAAGDPPPDRPVEIGEASVVIAAASPHRADAFAACRYAIERIKQIAPIWKHEHFEGGDVWIEGATADPADEDARARRRWSAHARNRPAVRAAAGDGRRGGAARGAARRRPRADAWDALVGEFPDFDGLRAAACRARSTKNTRA